MSKVKLVSIFMAIYLAYLEDMNIFSYLAICEYSWLACEVLNGKDYAFTICFIAQRFINCSDYRFRDFCLKYKFHENLSILKCL